MGIYRQIKAFLAAILVVSLVVSCAPRPSSQASATIERAKSFMASYAQELRNGDRAALAARYHPDGSFSVGDGKKALETHDETAAFYLSEWKQPKAFEWQDMSYELAGSGSIVVVGKFNWQEMGAAQGTTYSYTALLVPVAGQLKIRVEHESGTP